MVAINPSVKNRGIGRRMVLAGIERACTGWNARRFFGFVRRDDGGRLEGFWRGLGFQPVGIQMGDCEILRTEVERRED
jgi:ribosomal protein S18 acetylase RimI-like enzyme